MRGEKPLLRIDVVQHLRDNDVEAPRSRRGNCKEV